MNKYNIEDTVYYVNMYGIKKGKITGYHKFYDGDRYSIDHHHMYDHKEDMLYPTVEELIEWLKTTVK
jgi:hypothetical protein